MTICVDANDSSLALDPDLVRLPFYHPDLSNNTNTSCCKEQQMSPVFKIKNQRTFSRLSTSTRENEISGGKNEHSSLWQGHLVRLKEMNPAGKDILAHWVHHFDFSNDFLRKLCAAGCYHVSEYITGNLLAMLRCSFLPCYSCCLLIMLENPL